MKIHVLAGAFLFSAVLVASAGAQTLSKAKPNIAALGAVIDEALVRSRFDDGKALARTGQHAAALNEFLWLFDIGMPAVPAFRGVRTSFLLSEIGKLTTVYPHAREALLERCDEAERRFLANPNDRSAGADFAALCATLKDNQRLLKMFDALPAGDPRRRILGLRAYRILLPMRRYADALSAMPFESMVNLVDASAKSRSSATRSARMLETTRRIEIKTMLEYVEVLAGAGDLEHAKEMIGRLLAFDASAATQRALEETLRRAGQPQLLKPAP